MEEGRRGGQRGKEGRGGGMREGGMNVDCVTEWEESKSQVVVWSQGLTSP